MGQGADSDSEAEVVRQSPRRKEGSYMVEDWEKECLLVRQSLTLKLPQPRK